MDTFTETDTLKCCICLEAKSSVKCNHCNNGHYCDACIIQLIKTSQHNKCSTCRQENWLDESYLTRMQINKSSSDEDNDSSDEDYASRIEEIGDYEQYRHQCLLRLYACVSIVIFLIITTSIGYLFVFELCEANIKINSRYETIVHFIISALTGVVILMVDAIICYGNYKILSRSSCQQGDNICYPVNLLLIAVIAAIITLTGWAFLFKLCYVQLNVNRKHNIILQVICGYLMGSLLWGVLIALVCYIYMKLRPIQILNNENVLVTENNAVENNAVENNAIEVV